MDAEKDIEKALSRQDEVIDDDGQSSLAIGNDLEKEDSYLASPIQEPIKSHPRDGHGISRHTTQHSEHSGPPARRVTTAQDWTGPDDPENPHNWPLWKRVWHTVPPAIIAFAV
jgi:hypothetical protein